MPVLMTADFKGKEFYFDLRLGGVGDEPEGFWAKPVFESERKAIAKRCEARGKEVQAWIEILIQAITRWEGFYGPDGAVIECSADNIRSLCEADQGYMFGLLNKIFDAARTGKAVTEKNS